MLYPCSTSEKFSHACSVSHPDAFCADYLERCLCRRVMREFPRISVILIAPLSNFRKENTFELMSKLHFRRKVFDYASHHTTSHLR